RFAWLVFGDVYHRSHNNIAALIGIGCMFQVATSIDVEQSWQEGYLLVRILRDLDFFDSAKTVLERLQAIVHNLPARRANALHLETLALGVELSELSHLEDGDTSRLAGITDQIER